MLEALIPMGVVGLLILLIQLKQMRDRKNGDEK